MIRGLRSPWRAVSYKTRDGCGQQHGGMSIDLSSVAAFLATHARVLDRRRFELLAGADPAAVLAALDGYRNPDGGYGWGLEPDLRSPESQPGAALHALETFAEAGPATSPRAAQLCDWLDRVTLPGGGLPFALPTDAPAGNAPWWRDPDSTTSSLQITTITTANAHRVAAHDPAVAEHPWLGRATRYCLDTIANLDGPPGAYVLAFCLRFLDAAHRTHPKAHDLIDRLSEYVPADGVIRVQGGTENEALHPLDLSPFPGTPSRSLLRPEVIAADLDRLMAAQQGDGGWTVDYAKVSPAGVLDWRGYITVHNIQVLDANNRIT
jgi:hypothetical protein